MFFYTLQVSSGLQSHVTTGDAAADVIVLT